MTDKEMVINTLSRLPDSASLSDIQEEIRILEALREAEKDLLAGRIKSHEEVKEEFQKWITA